MKFVYNLQKSTGGFHTEDWTYWTRFISFCAVPLNWSEHCFLQVFQPLNVFLKLWKCNARQLFILLYFIPDLVASCVGNQNSTEPCKFTFCVVASICFFSSNSWFTRCVCSKSWTSTALHFFCKRVTCIQIHRRIAPLQLCWDTAMLFFMTTPCLPHSTPKPYLLPSLCKLSLQLPYFYLSSLYPALVAIWNDLQPDRKLLWNHTRHAASLIQLQGPLVSPHRNLSVWKVNHYAL